MTRPFAIAFLIAAFGLGTLTAAEAQNGARSQVSKQHTKKRIVRDSRGGQIACTVAGCAPVPRNCRPQPGMRWDGMPTGFDVIVCR